MAAAAARSLAAMPSVAAPSSISVSISPAATAGRTAPSTRTPGTSETKSSSAACSAPATAAAASSALTLKGRPPSAAGAIGAMTGVRPASSRLWSNDTRMAMISPTCPRPPGAGRAVSRPPSTPERPIASSPAWRSAATSMRFTGPASTISTTSATAALVTRRPSRFSIGSARRCDSALTASPPPCTSTTGPSTLSASAHAASHSGRSSSWPPSLTTRTLSMRAPSLRQAEHHVHVLDRLPRRALDEVVDRGDHSEPRPAHVGDRHDTNRHAIAVHDVLEGRQRATGEHDAGLAVIRGLVQPLRRRLVEHPRKRNMDRFEDPSLHGQEMGREDEIAAEAALARQRGPELGKVAVLISHRVGPEVLGHLPEQQLAPGRPAGAGHARCRVDHHFARRVDQ